MGVKNIEALYPYDLPESDEEQSSDSSNAITETVTPTV